MDDFIRLNLPMSYDLVVNDTFQLFYRGIIEAVNPYNYYISATCEKGQSYPRYFEITPQEEGIFDLVITVFSSDKSILATEKTKLIVTKVKKSPPKNVNILCVGDSLTAGGIWVEEAHRRLTGRDGYPKGNELSCFNFIGSRKRGKVGFEGYGGWTWEKFLNESSNISSAVIIETNAKKKDSDQHSIWQAEDGGLWQLEAALDGKIKFNRFNGNISDKPAEGSYLSHYANAEDKEKIFVKKSFYEDSSPFLNPETKSLDFRYYCQKNGFEKIDAAYILLSWNGLLGLDPVNHCKVITSAAKRFVDKLHEDYPQAVVKIMGLQLPSLNGGTGKSYGANLFPYSDKYELIRFVMELNRCYEAFAKEKKYSDFVEFINISGQFDSENNMPSTEKTVNTRNNKTESVGTNGVHPTEEGYLQIADAVYRNMVKCFCSD